MPLLWRLAELSIILWILYRFALRGAVRVAFKQAGASALAKQPDRIRLDLVPVPVWRDGAKAAAQADPLLALGFKDCGTYAPDKQMDVKIRILLNKDARAAAYVYEHPQAGVWTELGTRYEDGAMTMAVDRPPTGIQSPPFVRKIVGDPAEPTDRLFARLLKERQPENIKLLTEANVVREYEDAWMRIMVWQKNRGLSVAEVAAAARQRIEKGKPA